MEKFKYKPELKFSGHTECYNKIWKNNIENILSEELQEIK